MGNIFTPNSKGTAGKVTFFIFEIAALVVFAFFFIFAIIDAARLDSFVLFMQEFFQGVIYTLLIFGFGRVIDLLYSQTEGKAEKKEKKEKKEDTEKKD